MRRYKYVDKVGVELEGGWDDERELEHDGSVDVQARYTGELPSPPCKPAALIPWMGANYPDAVNATCGMHVHVSLRCVSQYAKLMEYDFHEYLKRELLAWGKRAKIIKNHPFWSRLAGENHYCQDVHRPEAQFLQTDKYSSRYAMINYTWARYGTIEIRVLPAFKLCRVAQAAVLALLDIFESYLDVQPKKSRAGAHAGITLDELVAESPAPVNELYEEGLFDEYETRQTRRYLLVPHEVLDIEATATVID